MHLVRFCCFWFTSEANWFSWYVLNYLDDVYRCLISLTLCVRMLPIPFFSRIHWGYVNLSVLLVCWFFCSFLLGHSLWCLDFFLALPLDFAQECKRLSVGEFDESLFSLNYLSCCTYINHWFELICLLFSQFCVWSSLSQKFIFIIKLDFLSLSLLFLFLGLFGNLWVPATIRILTITRATGLRFSSSLACFKAKTIIYKCYEESETQFGL